MKYEKPKLHDLSGREVQTGAGQTLDSLSLCFNGNADKTGCRNGNINSMGPCRNGNYARGWHNCQNGSHNTGS